MILTNERGEPIERPLRSDYTNAVDFIRAFHAFKDRVANTANEAFTVAFRDSNNAREDRARNRGGW